MDFCTVLRDDGLSYQDYLEQLTTLLFLKMADERAALTQREQPIPRGYRRENLISPSMEGVRLEEHYRETLRVLGQQGRGSPYPAVFPSGTFLSWGPPKTSPVGPRLSLLSKSEDVTI